jgi:hypothetical protein
VLTPLALLTAALGAAPHDLPAQGAGLVVPLGAAEALVGGPEPRLDHLAPSTRVRSKKEQWRLEKATRPDVHIADAELARPAPPPVRRPPGKAAPAPGVAAVTGKPPVGSRIEPVTTLFNLRTREALPIVPGLRTAPLFDPFLRDHFTNQATRMDARLLDVLSRAARRFSASRIEVVSGYRSPKYNLMLRKKGREVARTSQHTQGHAVDFRIRGVPAKSLLQFVRSLRLGGVGYYPHSQFVHADTGPIRFWKGS